MSPNPLTLRRDACPGITDAMSENDGMLMRVLLPGGAVSDVQLDVIAEVASGYGNGVVEITTRANLQIRGIDAERVGIAAEALVHAGLAELDPSINARRAIVAPALAGHDPLANIDATPFIAAITDTLRATELTAALPAKFSVVIDDQSPFGVGDLAGHVAISLSLSDSPGLVADSVADAARELSAMRTPEPVERVRPIVVAAFVGPAVGFYDHIESDRCNVIAAPAFGRLDATQLRALVDLCAHGSIRFTHRRAVAIAGVERTSLDLVLELLDEAGLSPDAADPVHSVTACAGSPGCASSRANTLAAATVLVVERRKHVDGARAERVHFSGCEKLCGAPANARLIIAELDGRLEVGR